MATLTTKAFWIMSGDAGSRFLNFLATVYLARVLGTANFGLISIGLSVLGYAVWISDMGLVKIGTRETAKKPSKREYFPSGIFWIRFAAGLAVLAAATFLVFVLPLQQRRTEIIGLFILSVLPHALLLDWYYNGQQKYREVAVGQFCKSAVYLLLIYSLIQAPQQTSWVPLFYLAGSISGMGYLFVRLKKPGKIFRFNLTYKSTLSLIKKSLTIGLGTSFSRVVQLLPPIVIGIFISASSAGIYSAAMKLVMVGTLLDRVFVNLFLPIFTSYWQQKPGQAPQLIKRIFRIMLLAGLLFSITFMTTSKWLVVFLFGSEYQASIPLLQILSWFLVFTFANSVFSFGLLAINQDQPYVRSTLRGGFVAAVLICGFTLLGSAYWTAFSVLLSEIIITGFNYYEFQKHIDPAIKRPTMAGGTAVGIILLMYFILPFSILIQLPLFIAMVLGIYFLLGGTNSSDLTWFLKTLKR